MTTRKVTDLNLESVKRLGTPAFMGSILAVGILVIGGAVLVGKSDQGVIDVTAAIQNSNQTNTDGGDSSNNVNTIPEAFKNIPNGGLVPAENQDIPPPAPPVEVASTTETDSEAVPAEGTPEESAEDETQVQPESVESGEIL